MHARRVTYQGQEQERRLFLIFPRAPCPALGNSAHLNLAIMGKMMSNELKEPWPETPSEPCPECGGMAPICNTTRAGDKIIEHYFCDDCALGFEGT